MGGQGCALLPTDDVAGVISCQIDPALGLDPEFVAGGSPGFETADPRTRGCTGCVPN